MNSMTGFGRASEERAELRVTAELRTVNHRHLDVEVRGPRLSSGGP